MAVPGPLRPLALLCVATLVTLAPRHALAQGRRVVLRPEGQLEPLARRVATVLRRRGAAAIVGEEPPPIVEAVTHGHVALVRESGAFLLVLGGAAGRTHRSAIVVDPRDPGTARALALAVESLLDEAARAAVPEQTGPAAAGPPETAGADGGVSARPPRAEGARPTVYLRVLAGWSPRRQRPLLGPGAGLGLCVGAHCVVIEADLPLLPDEVRLETGERLRYRAVTTSVRAQLRPFVWGDVSLGLTLGLLSRVGTASLVGGEFRQTATNLGARASLEVGWRIAGPLEWVFEAGADVILANSRARAFVHGQHVFLEDRWTPWLVMSLRLRPLGREAQRGGR